MSSQIVTDVCGSVPFASFQFLRTVRSWLYFVRSRESAQLEQVTQNHRQMALIVKLSPPSPQVVHLTQVITILPLRMAHVSMQTFSFRCGSRIYSKRYTLLACLTQLWFFTDHPFRAHFRKGAYPDMCFWPCTLLLQCNVLVSLRLYKRT